MTASEFTRGIRENRVQVAHQLIQVMLVGFAIGMTRTVVPALAATPGGAVSLTPSNTASCYLISGVPANLRPTPAPTTIPCKTCWPTSCAYLISST